MPQILLARSFLQAQGYESSVTVVGHDNQSITLLEQHRQACSSKVTRHINIRYVFVAHRISSGDLESCCSTVKMLANYFMKPLKGSLFKRYERAAPI